MDDGDLPKHTLAVAGLSAYVEVRGKKGEQRVVLCRACGARVRLPAPARQFPTISCAA
jgi:RNase P subunit RPR2